MVKENIALIGFYGQNLDNIGKLLAENMSMQFCSVNELIEYEYENFDILFEMFGETGYRKYERNVVEQVCAYKNVIISVFPQTMSVENNVELINSRTMTIYLADKTKTLFQNANETQKNFVKKPTYKAFEEEFKLMKQILLTCDITIQINNLSIEQTVEKIIKKILEKI